MKRIELVIDPSALDRFIEAARMMNLSDFDVTEVRRSLRTVGGNASDCTEV